MFETLKSIRSSTEEAMHSIESNYPNKDAVMKVADCADVIIGLCENLKEYSTKCAETIDAIIGCMTIRPKIQDGITVGYHVYSKHNCDECEFVSGSRECRLEVSMSRMKFIYATGVEESDK
jgi:hypothetical protein